MKKSIYPLAIASFLMLLSCKGGGNINSSENNAVIQNILERKSVRSYTERPVEQEKLELLLRAGMAAPSARDLRPWELIVVNDRALLNGMAEGLPFAKMLASAPLAIVVCGDEQRSTLWDQDCCAVTQNILLAAESLGLGAVWTAAYPYEDRMGVVSGALGLPSNVKPLCVIPVGYPKGPQSPKQKYDEAKVHLNKW